MVLRIKDKKFEKCGKNQGIHQKHEYSEKRIFSQYYCPLYLYMQLFHLKMQTLFKTEENKDRMDTPGCSLYLDRPFCYKP